MQVSNPPKLPEKKVDLVSHPVTSLTLPVAWVGDVEKFTQAFGLKSLIFFMTQWGGSKSHSHRDWHLRCSIAAWYNHVFWNGFLQYTLRFISDHVIAISRISLHRTNVSLQYSEKHLKLHFVKVTFDCNGSGKKILRRKTTSSWGQWEREIK